MSRASPIVADRAREEDERQWRTVLAFLLAPGLAAVTGGFALVVFSFLSEPGGQFAPSGVSALWGQFANAALGTLLGGFYFGLIGYPTAALASAPLYAMLPVRARASIVAVVLLAGGSAAVPWLIFSPFAGAGALVGAAVAFPLGCVAGVAFVLVRRGWRR